MYLLIILFVSCLFLASCGSSNDNNSMSYSYCSNDYINYYASSSIFQNDANLNPLWKDQWDLHANNNGNFGNPSIDVNASQIRNNGGHKVIIAVIDDGFNLNHEDFKNPDLNVIKKWNLAYPYNNSFGDPSQDISEGIDNKENHGTATLGIIAARDNNVGIMGLATTPNFQFILIKMKFGKNSSVTIANLVSAFANAKKWGADIISCSWGTNEGIVPLAEKEAITDAATSGGIGGKGINVVFSSGNGQKVNGENYGVDISNEADISEVISVGASNSFNRITQYSNFGGNLDLVAPGGGYHFGMLGIPTLLGSSNDGYYNFNNYPPFIGTSASAPLVSGAIALMLAKNPTLTRVQVSNILHESSDKIGTFSYQNGHNPCYGYGKLDVAKALRETP